MKYGNQFSATLSPNSKKKKSRPAVYIYKATTLALFAFVIRILFGCWRMPLSSFPPWQFSISLLGSRIEFLFLLPSSCYSQQN